MASLPRELRIGNISSIQDWPVYWKKCLIWDDMRSASTQETLTFQTHYIVDSRNKKSTHPKYKVKCFVVLFPAQSTNSTNHKRYVHARHGLTQGLWSKRIKKRKNEKENDFTCKFEGRRNNDDWIKVI